MNLRRLLLTLATSVAVLPHAWAAPLELGDLEGLPTIVVDGVTCTLPDAIMAANSNTTVGGCVGSLGIEALVLETDVTLTQASMFSATVGGAQAGLPDIDSSIVIVGNGRTIERDAALTCEPDDPAGFRLFTVLPSGALFLTDVSLRGGCVAPAEGIQAEGGAIHVAGGTLELNGVELEGHRALGTAAGDDGAAGGALYCAHASITTIYDSSFDNNVARGIDGQAASTKASGGGGHFEECQVGSIELSSISGNMAVGSSDLDRPGDGGGLLLRQTEVEVFRHVSFQDNVAQGGNDSSGGSARGARGGGLNLQNSTIQVFSHATFLRNQARGGSSTLGPGSFGEGGAISVEGGSLPIIVQSHFEDNLALGGNAGGDSSPGNCGGGAIRIGSSGMVDGIADSLFAGNTCQGGQKTGIGGGVTARGGAIRLSSGEITTIERVTFANNLALGGVASSANSDGGAMRADGPISLLANSTFVGNRAVGGIDNDPDDLGPQGQGGALMLSDPVLMMHGNSFVNNVAEGGVGGAGLGPARGGAIVIEFSGTATVGGSIFSGNLSQLADGTSMPDDCFDENSNLVSEGWNRVESPGNCTFAATGDQTGVVTATYPLADWGCESPLPDGSCVPTAAIDETSPALDQGSCADVPLLNDSRSFLRPFDLPAVANADDGCDVGAFEARDTDGDGFTEATDCAPDDPSVHAVDLCGVCGGSSACVIFLDGFETGDTSAWDD